MVSCFWKSISSIEIWWVLKHIWYRIPNCTSIIFESTPQPTPWTRQYNFKDLQICLLLWLLIDKDLWINKELIQSLWLYRLQSDFIQFIFSFFSFPKSLSLLLQNFQTWNFQLQLSFVTPPHCPRFFNREFSEWEPRSFLLRIQDKTSKFQDEEKIRSQSSCHSLSISHQVVWWLTTVIVLIRFFVLIVWDFPQFVTWLRSLWNLHTN